MANGTDTPRTGVGRRPVRLAIVDGVRCDPAPEAAPEVGPPASATGPASRRAALRASAAAMVAALPLRDRPSGEPLD